MSQSAISNRLTSLSGFKGKELDLHSKLSIQAKQNALPKGTFYLKITSLLNDFISDIWAAETGAGGGFG